MNIDDALNQASDEQSEAGEVLRITGTLESDAAEGKIRIYPSLGDRRRYVLVDRDSVAGDVIDVTAGAREHNPAQLESVFSVPVAKASEIQLVAITSITIDDPAAMRNLSFDQSRRAAHAGCSCAGQGGRDSGSYGCETGQCEPVGGGTYPCSEIDPSTGLVYCSGCCVALTR